METMDLFTRTLAPVTSAAPSTSIVKSFLTLSLTRRVNGPLTCCSLNIHCREIQFVLCELKHISMVYRLTVEEKAVTDSADSSLYGRETC